MSEKLEDFDAAWKEADGKGADAEPDQPAGQDPGLPDDADKQAQKEPVGDSAAPPEPKAEDQSPVSESEHGDMTSVVKALKDTKAHATRLAQEKAELKRQLEEMAKKGRTEESGEDLAAVASQVYEDYPELKPLMDKILSQNQALIQDLESLKQSTAERETDRQRQEAREHFDREIKPAVVREHADFDAIVRGDDYWEWAGKQRPALKYAATNSPDPEDINWALREFKKFKGSDQAREMKSGQENKRKQLMTNAQALRGGGSPYPKAKGQVDPKDYDGAWDEAEKESRTQGARA